MFVLVHLQNYMFSLCWNTWVITLQSFTRSDRFISAQFSLPDYTEDFLTLVKTYNAYTVVSLYPLDEVQSVRKFLFLEFICFTIKVVIGIWLNEILNVKNEFLFWNDSLTKHVSSIISMQYQIGYLIVIAFYHTMIKI